jgi:hypothetical protein
MISYCTTIYWVIFRYVDDILIVYDSDKTDITNVLNSCNTATHPMQFIVEKNKIIRSVSWISRSRRNKTTLHTTYTENPPLQISSSLKIHVTQQNINTVQYGTYRTQMKLTSQMHIVNNKKNTLSTTSCATTVMILISHENRETKNTKPNQALN